MKRFGKVFLTKGFIIRLIVGVCVFIALDSFATYVTQTNRDIVAHNQAVIAGVQAGVDSFNSKIHTEVASVKNAVGLYNAFVTAHPDDRSTDTVGTANDLANGIFSHQFACQNLIEDYNKQKTTWPSYAHIETHSILECQGK